MPSCNGEPVDRSDECHVLETSPGPVLSGVLEPAGAGNAPSGREAALVELFELPLPALRRRRALLQEEARRVQHWRRLVRARRDLLVAVACGPEDLHVPVEAASSGGPLELHLGAGRRDWTDPPADHALDPARGLRGLLVPDRRAGNGDLSGQLHELSAAERRLAGYGDAVLDELAVATDVLTERCRAVLGPASG
ncbi:hypothetical protein [Kineococcus sp. SYSU DK003]|uniref:hypothetical protein n=1 Tax=Kineococcus sp. SYSU DK003 TaxID=3383124 RepID=UPI003D7D7315